MAKHVGAALLLVGGTLLLTWPAGADEQSKERVYRQLTPDQVESILTEMGIKYNKTQPPKAPKDYDYDFERNRHMVRLTLSNGKMLWLSSNFPKAPLERINQWNVNAKFSRAVNARVGDLEYAFVEYQLDVYGGVTENIVKQFIRRFDNEVHNFDQFLRNN